MRQPERLDAAKIARGDAATQKRISRDAGGAWLGGRPRRLWERIARVNPGRQRAHGRAVAAQPLGSQRNRPPTETSEVTRTPFRPDREGERGSGSLRCSINAYIHTLRAQ